MSTVITLSILALLCILAAFAVGGKAWGFGVLAFVVVVVLGILALQYYAGRWL